MSRLLAWLGLTVLGFVLAAGLHFPGTLDDVGFQPGGFEIGAVTGLVIGAIQLVVLRGVMRPLWLWPIVMAAGIAVTHGLGDGLSEDVGYLPVAVGGGLATGVLQAVALRQTWWAIATCAGFVIGIAGGAPLTAALGFQDLTRHVIMSAATGLAYAGLTAPLLLRKWAALRLPSDRKR